MTQQPRRDTHLRVVKPADAPMTRLGNILPAQLRIDPNAPTPEAPADLYWECEQCGLVEPLYIPAGRGRWIKRTCACQRQARHAAEYEKQRQAWLAEQQHRCFGGWLGTKWVDHKVTAEMGKMTFANFDTARNNFAFQDAYNLALNFARMPKGSLLFYGSYGTGKTHLEAAICNFLRSQNTPSLFVSAPLFFTAYNDALNYKNDLTRELSLIQQVIETPLLVLDDVDKARPTDPRLDTYFMIIDERCKAGRPTVISTNKKDELAHYMGDAVVSRLYSGQVDIEMIGDDQRLVK